MLTIYADVLFAINFSMDFLCLFLSGRILHCKIVKRRIVCSSLIGGAYGVMSVAFEMKTLVSFVISFSVAIIMCLVCYNYTKIKSLLTSVLIFMFISTSMGGIMSVLFSLFNSVLADIIKKVSYEWAYNGARSIIIIALTGIVALILTKTLSRRKDIKTVMLTVNLNNTSYRLSGLCDTGNLLKEPFSGKSVILIGAYSRLGKEINNISESKIRYIPYKDINSSGILKGVFPNEVSVNDKKVDVFLAVSRNKDFNGNDALVPYAII